MNENITTEKDIIQACLDIVENTDFQHAYTSYDVNLIEATVEKIKQNITEYFKQNGLY